MRRYSIVSATTLSRRRKNSFAHGGCLRRTGIKELVRLVGWTTVFGV